MSKQEIPEDMRCGECYHMKAWSYTWCNLHDKPVMMFDRACDDVLHDESTVEIFKSYRENVGKGIIHIFDEDKE